MGIIATATPGAKSFKPVPQNPAVTAVSALEAGHIPVQYYNAVSSDLSLKYSELRDMSVEDVTWKLDLLWKLSWPLHFPRPGWSGMMQAVSNGLYPGKSTVTFLPMIDMDPTNLSCIFSTLQFVSSLAARYDVTPVLTFDQPLLWKAQTIIDCEPHNSPLRSIVLRLRGFHTEKSFLGCIGHLMAGSGLQQLLEVVFAPNAVNHMLSGKSVARAVRGHFLVESVLNALITSETFNFPLPASIDPEAHAMGPVAEEENCEVTPARTETDMERDGSSATPDPTRDMDSTVLKTCGNQVVESALPIQAPCQIERAQIVFPRIVTTATTTTTTTRGCGGSSPVPKPPEVEEPEPEVVEPEPEVDGPIVEELPRVFQVHFPWRGRHRRLTLFRSDVTSPRTVTLYEDEEREDRVAETEGEGEGTGSCQYQGFASSGEGESYAALSVCQGLVGVIQLGDDVLFIEPTRSARKERRGLGRLWQGRAPHLIYTCLDRKPAAAANGNTTGLSEEPSVPSPQWKRPNTEDRLWRVEGGEDGRQGSPNVSRRHQHTQRRRRRRKKRSEGKRHYLEVQLVVDHTVVAMHGTKRAPHYVLTLMNIANSVYQHPSLGVNVRVVVTELVLLQPHEQKDVVVKSDAFGTVQKFCAWSNRQHPLTRAIRHDLALLLTRENLGPAGYAPITGMCDPSRSCALVTDEGFNSGFIIAHEMAHVFGLVHDGPENGCWGPAYSSAIMTPLVEAKLNRFRWSECSRARMQEVIDYLFCLDDNPDIDSEVDDHYALDTGHILPGDLGRQWSLNFQCRLEFGYRSNLCSAFRDNACSVLWCSDSSSPYLCRTKRGPPMPGSSCGYAMECRDRRCVYMGREKAVDGGWTPWGEWGDCSVHCGVGIKRRRRFCYDPRPAYGGRPCPGEAESWDTCRTTKDCQEHYDLRAVQCTVWDELIVRRGQHAWKPYPARAESDRCYQTCVSSSTGEVVILRTPVADGTPCDYNTSHICFHGKCLAVGCDGVQNSNKTFDSCGVCDGDHSQCQTVSGHFTRQPSSEDEYEPVLFLPKGSRHVEVINKGKASHFIALRELEEDSYVLNGNGEREESRAFVVAGALFEYERKFGYQAVRSPGPLYVNLEVMLYPAHDLSNASIRYQYSVSRKDTTLQRHRYRWRHKDWSPCSVSCGEGVKTGVQVCYDRDTGEERTEDTCQYLDPPAAETAPCLHDPCSQKRHVWTVTPEEWGACNASECGQQGQQQQGYSCQVHFPHNHSYVSVHPTLCDPSALPLVTRACWAPPCQLIWIVGEWSECSVTCGPGRQRRSVHCGDPLTDSDDIWCQDIPPALSRDCDSGPCNGIPTVGPPSSGKECRDILSICSLPNSLDHKCHSRRFQILCCHSCRLQQSASAARTPRLSQRAIHRWVLVEDSWGRCSVERCGEEGEERQEHRCQAFFPHNLTSPPLTANPHHCGPPLSAPRVTRKCHTPPCGMTWTLGPWSQCSVTCGPGRQRRSVHCGDPLTDSDDIWCQDIPPALSRDCDSGPCNGVTMKKGACLDKYSFCRHALGLSLKCLSKGFRLICCKTCRQFRRTARRKQAGRSHGARHKPSANKLNPSKWTARKRTGNESVRRMRMGRLHRPRKHGSKKQSKRLVKKPAAAIRHASPRRAGAKKSGRGRKAEKMHRPTARKRPAAMKNAAEDTVAAAVVGINASEGIASRETESKLAARMRAVNERYARRHSARARTANKHSANDQSAANISEAGSSSKLPAANAPSKWDLYRQRLYKRGY